jgi:hypothetical protein
MNIDGLLFFDESIFLVEASTKNRYKLKHIRNWFNIFGNCTKEIISSQYNYLLDMSKRLNILIPISTIY